MRAYMHGFMEVQWNVYISWFPYVPLSLYLDHTYTYTFNFLSTVPLRLCNICALQIVWTSALHMNPIVFISLKRLRNSQIHGCVSMTITCCLCSLNQKGNITKCLISSVHNTMYNIALLHKCRSKVKGQAKDKTTAGRYNNTEPRNLEHFQK